MLVYEYVNNGNLEQWLHGDVGPCSPLTWDIRMNVILGTAKGYDFIYYSSLGSLLSVLYGGVVLLVMNIFIQNVG